MAKLVFVKSARKDNSVAKIGESYYWASFRVGRSSVKKFWKERPPRSELTMSSFYSQIYALEDRGFNGGTIADLENERDEIVADLESLRSECEDSLSNMPEGLQEGDTGQLLQARIDGLESTSSEFENVDFDDQEDDESEEDWVDRKREELDSIGFDYE